MYNNLRKRDDIRRYHTQDIRVDRFRFYSTEYHHHHQYIVTRVLNNNNITRVKMYLIISFVTFTCSVYIFHNIGRNCLRSRRGSVICNNIALIELSGDRGSRR